MSILINSTINTDYDIKLIDEIWKNIKEFMISNTDFKTKFNKICYEIYKPYEFSDDVNKSFARQYNYIKNQKQIVEDMNSKLIRKMVVEAIRNAKILYY